MPQKIWQSEESSGDSRLWLAIDVILTLVALIVVVWKHVVENAMLEPYFSIGGSIVLLKLGGNIYFYYSPRIRAKVLRVVTSLFGAIAVVMGLTLLLQVAKVWLGIR